MKRVIALFACVFAVSVASAQNEFEKGVTRINLGVGVGGSTFGEGYSTTVPPIAASAEWGVVDELFDAEACSLGVGGYLGYTAAKYKYAGVNYGYNVSGVIIGARSAIHYQFNVKKLDTYGGLMVGYNIASAKAYGNWGNTPTTNLSVGGFSWSLYFGANYRFTEKLGAFAELGYGISYLTLGLSLKL
ncbi:MAG: hypothetical protein LBH06_02990 [Rikenellaceae bacterium]|jgi:hypothetical protein|nr:hypothetical protein [Rikenellaceae bacterium]